MFLHQYIRFGNKYGPLMKDLWNNPNDKDAIIERYRPQFQTVKEGFSDDDSITMDDKGLQAAVGLGTGLLVLYVIIGLVFFGLLIWNIVALAHYWKKMDNVWRILALVFLLLGGFPVSLILIYVGKSASHKKKHHDDDDDDDDDNDGDDDENRHSGSRNSKKARSRSDKDDDDE